MLQVRKEFESSFRLSDWLEKAFKTASEKKENITTQDAEEIGDLIVELSKDRVLTSVWWPASAERMFPHCKDLVLLFLSYLEINHQYRNLRKYNAIFRELSCYEVFKEQYTIFEPHNTVDCDAFLDLCDKGLNNADDLILLEPRLNWFYIGLYKVFQNHNRVTEDSAQLFAQSALLFLSENLSRRPLPLEASKAFKYLKKESAGGSPIALFYSGFIEIHSSVLCDKSDEEKKNMLRNGFEKIREAKNRGYTFNIVLLKKITPIADLFDKIDTEEEFFRYAINSHNDLKNFLAPSPVSESPLISESFPRLQWYYMGVYHARKEKTDEERILNCFYQSAAQRIEELTPQDLAELDKTGLEKEFILHYLIEDAKSNNPYALFYKGFINLQLSGKIRAGDLKQEIFNSAKTDISSAMKLGGVGIRALKIGSKTVAEILSKELQESSQSLVFSLPNQPRPPKVEQPLEREENKETQGEIDALSYFVLGRITDKQSKIDAFSAELKRTFEQVSAKKENITAKDIQEILELMGEISSSTLDTKDNLISDGGRDKILDYWQNLALLLINYFEFNHQYTDLKKYNEIFKEFVKKYRLKQDNTPFEYHNSTTCDVFLTLVGEKPENITAEPQHLLERLESYRDGLKWFYLGLYDVFQNKKMTEDSAQLFFQSALFCLPRHLYHPNWALRTLEVLKAFKYLKKESAGGSPIALFYCGLLEIHSSASDLQSDKKNKESLRDGFKKIKEAKNRGYILDMVSLKKITPIADLFDKIDTEEEFFKKYDAINSYGHRKKFLQDLSCLEWYYTGLYEARKQKTDRTRMVHCFYQSAMDLIRGLTLENLAKLDKTGLDKEFILQPLIEEAKTNPYALFTNGLINLELLGLINEKIKAEGLKQQIFENAKIYINFAMKVETDKGRIMGCFFEKAREVILGLTPRDLAKLDKTGLKKVATLNQIGLDKKFIIESLIEEAENRNPYALLYTGYINLALSKKIEKVDIKQQIFKSGTRDVTDAINLDRDLLTLKIGSKTVAEIFPPLKREKSSPSLVFSLPNQPVPHEVEQPLEREENEEDTIARFSEKKAKH